MIPTSRISREFKAMAAGSVGYTPSFSAVSELSTRKRRRLFRRTMLYAAQKAYAAGSISATYYGHILELYKHPWRTTSAGVQVDVLERVAYYMNHMAHNAYGAYVTDWWGQVLATSPSTLLARDWLALCTSGGMLGAGNNAGTDGLVFAVEYVLANDYAQPTVA